MYIQVILYLFSATHCIGHGQTTADRKKVNYLILNVNECLCNLPHRKTRKSDTTMYCHLDHATRSHCELKIFGASGHQRLNFDGCIYIRHAAPPYSAGTVIMVNLYGRWVTNPALFFVIWHSFVERRIVTKLAVFSTDVRVRGWPGYTAVKKYCQKIQPLGSDVRVISPACNALCGIGLDDH